MQGVQILTCTSWESKWLYQVLIEERIYQVESEDSILIGVPDITIHKVRSTFKPVISGNVAVADPDAQPDIQPRTVTLMYPETVRQS